MARIFVFRKDEFIRLVNQLQNQITPILNNAYEPNSEIYLINSYNALIRYASTEHHKRKQETKKLIEWTIVDARNLIE